MAILLNDEINSIRARFKKVQSSNIYDALAEMGYPNQCLDLNYLGLKDDETLVGPAVTVRGTTMAFCMDEYQKYKGEGHDYLAREMYEGCVLVLESGGDTISGKLGEFLARRLKKQGAKGALIDGPIRDVGPIRDLEDFTVYCKGRTPIPTDRNWFFRDVNEPITLKGALSAMVRVNPGDWIVADIEGVMVIPKEMMLKVLGKSEEIAAQEESLRIQYSK